MFPTCKITFIKPNSYILFFHYYDLVNVCDISCYEYNKTYLGKCYSNKEKATHKFYVVINCHKYIQISGVLLSPLKTAELDLY